jgi:hypothetical protein
VEKGQDKEQDHDDRGDAGEEVEPIGVATRPRVRHVALSLMGSYANYDPVAGLLERASAETTGA